MANILIIDDDEMLCKMLMRYVKRMGHEATYALTMEEGRREVSSRTIDVVFLDVNLPDGNGLDALPLIAKAPSSPEVIIITGEGDPDGAELAIKSGAWAYVEKPLSMKKTALQLVRALQYRSERAGLKSPLWNPTTAFELRLPFCSIAKARRARVPHRARLDALLFFAAALVSGFHSRRRVL